ncbi:hypothetical protein D3C87_1499450 [compost metagenome]
MVSLARRHDGARLSGQGPRLGERGEGEALAQLTSIALGERQGLLVLAKGEARTEHEDVLVADEHRVAIAPTLVAHEARIQATALMEGVEALTDPSGSEIF